MAFVLTPGYLYHTCEPEEVLDRGWFTNAATRAVLVYARTFTDYGVEDQIAGKDGCVRFLNVTEHYAETKTCCIRATDEENHPLSDASVSIEILNMAEFFSVTGRCFWKLYCWRSVFRF